MLRKVKRLGETLLRLLHVDRRLDEIKINQGRLLAAQQQPQHGSPLSLHEFKVFSQWGEDGILQYLTQHIDIQKSTFIELGIEDFSESNCRFLMMKDYWHGFVIDGSDHNIRRLRSSYYYWQYQLQSKAAFITKENVAALLDESGFGKDLGILSIDIDGVDWHVLEALGSWRPAILVVEYNDAFGFTQPVTVPYDSDFVRAGKHPSNLYWGASLPAFDYLARRRDYALVGINGAGSNAFFVRRDLLNEHVREVPVAACTRMASFRDSRDVEGRPTFLSGADRVRTIADMPLVDVSTGATIKVGDLRG